MSELGQSVYAFGRFRLDAGKRLLFAGGDRVSLLMRPTLARRLTPGFSDGHKDRRVGYSTMKK